MPPRKLPRDNSAKKRSSANHRTSQFPKPPKRLLQSTINEQLKLFFSNLGSRQHPTLQKLMYQYEGFDNKFLESFLSSLNKLPLKKQLSFLIRLNNIEESLRFIETKRKISSFLNNRKEERKPLYQSPFDKKDNTYLVVEGNSVHRNIFLSSLDAWKSVQDLPVEQIKEIREFDPVFFFNLILNKSRAKLSPEQISLLFEKIKSELSYFAKTQKEVVSKLEKGLCLPNFLQKYSSPDIALNLMRQITDVLSSLWARGVVHGHPHSLNFIVKWEKQNPKIILIDFTMASKYPLKKEKDWHAFEKILSSDFNFVNSPLSHLKITFAVLNQYLPPNKKLTFNKWLNQILSLARKKWQRSKQRNN